MRPEELADHALSLPEAHEAPHFARRSFRIGKRIFATLTQDGDEAMVKVGTPERIAELLSAHPRVFFSYGGWTTRGGALGVHVAAASSRLLRGLVTEAWRGVAPRRALAALDSHAARKAGGRRRVG